MSFRESVEIVGKALDTVGVGVMVIGIMLAGIIVARGRATFDLNGYRVFRQGVGRAILLGLEFLVAADIIRTVAVSPTIRSAAILAIIVLIRTFLSFALEVELQGRWPWQAHAAHAQQTERR